MSLLRKKLQTALQSTTPVPLKELDDIYFEVDFWKVTGLVGRRQVYVQGGKAYVPMRDQVDLVLDDFKEKLADALEVLSNGSIQLCPCLGSQMGGGSSEPQINKQRPFSLSSYTTFL